MKFMVWIVNCVCGGVVDEEVIVEVINNGVIVGVGLDVYVSEFLVEDFFLWVVECGLVLMFYFGVLMEEVQENVVIDVVEQICDVLLGLLVCSVVNIFGFSVEIMEWFKFYFQFVEIVGLFVSQLVGGYVKEMELCL